jgi:photosystem II stability/assembly factor-like uncharacterized protein
MYRLRLAFVVLLFLVSCSRPAVPPQPHSPLSTATQVIFTATPTRVPPTDIPSEVVAEVTPPPYNPLDLTSAIQRLAFALQNQQPGLLKELIGSRGAQFYPQWPDQVLQPGSDNENQVIIEIASALQPETPTCVGYNPNFQGDPRQASVVFNGLKLDWRKYGAEVERSQTVMFTFVQRETGWELAMINPIYTDQHLALLGEQKPCPGGAMPLPSGGEVVHLQQLKMFTIESGWGIDKQGRVLWTTSGMQDWKNTLPAISGEMQFQTSAFFLDANTAIVVYGSDPAVPPEIWHTEDGGETWLQGGGLTGPLLPGLLPLQLEFVDPLHGWFLGQVYTGMHRVEIVLFETLDGGLTWELIHTSHPDFSVPAQTGFLRGSYSLPYGRELMAFLDPTTGFAGNGSLYTSRDSGRSWLPVNLPIPEEYPVLVWPYNYISPPRFSSPSDGHVLMNIYEYEQTFNPPGDIFDGLPQALFIFITEDGGLTWSPHPAPAASGEAFFLDTEHGWFLGTDDLEEAGAKLFFTSNHGQSWKLLQGKTPFPFGTKLYFIDEGNGWALLDAPDANTGVSMYTTRDGGLTWGSLAPRLQP